MAYNRMSQQFHGNQQHSRGRKKEDENDALMRLVRSVEFKNSLLFLTRVTD